MCRLRRPAAETERQDEFPAACGKIDLARERDIAVFGEVVGPCERIMPRKVLPSIGGADETDRPRAPRRRAAERQRIAASRGEEHFAPLMVGKPSGVVGTTIHEMRSEEGIEAEVAALPPLGLAEYNLEDDIADRIGQHVLFGGIATLTRE